MIIGVDYILIWNGQRFIVILKTDQNKAKQKHNSMNEPHQFIKTSKLKL